MPGLRFAERRSHALLQALLTFRCHPNGFANKDLRTLTSELRGLDPAAVTVGQTTYDLRRLKSRDLITRIPGTHRYQVTDHGLDTAKFLTTVHDRILPTGWPNSAPPTPHQAGSEPPPPPTAKQSTPSPPQHNSPDEQTQSPRTQT